MRLRIDPSLSEEAIEYILAGKHTAHERLLVLGAWEPGDVVMERGGGIGMVAIACAQRIGSERVFSYEANPALRPLFEQNCALNLVEPTLYTCMLGPAAGAREFHVARNFRESSTFDRRVAAETITVPVRAFNEEVARIRPTFLIVDIEGGEYELFEYARLDGVSKIMLELHDEVAGPSRSNALRRKLRRMGFHEEGSTPKHFLYRRPVE